MRYGHHLAFARDEILDAGRMTLNPSRKLPSLFYYLTTFTFNSTSTSFHLNTKSSLRPLPFYRVLFIFLFHLYYPPCSRLAPALCLLFYSKSSFIVSPRTSVLLCLCRKKAPVSPQASQPMKLRHRGNNHIHQNSLGNLAYMTPPGRGIPQCS